MNNDHDSIDILLLPNEEEIELNEAILADYWTRIMATDTGTAFLDGRQVFVEGVKSILGKGGIDESLYLTTKGWKVKMKAGLVKSLLVAPAVGGLLFHLGFMQLADIIIPTIIPLLFDVENIQLTRKEEEIWMNLPVRSEKKSYKTAEQWYESLPAKVRKQVNEYDFKDFIDKLVLAGFARKQKGDRFLIFKKGKNIFKLTFE